MNDLESEPNADDRIKIQNALLIKDISSDASYCDKIKSLRLHLDETIHQHSNECERSRAVSCVTIHQILQLACSLDKRYVLLGHINDAQTRVDLYQEAQGMLSREQNDDLKPYILVGLAEAVIDLYFGTPSAPTPAEHKSSELEESIALCRSIILTLDKMHEKYPESLRVLGMGLYHRSLSLKNKSDLDEAIEVYKLACSDQFRNHSSRPQILHALAQSYLQHYNLSGDRENLKAASWVLEDLLPLHRRPTFDTCTALQTAGRVFFTYGRATTDAKWIQLATTLFMQAVNVCEVLQISQSRSLANMTAGYVLVAELTDDFTILTGALDRAQKALSAVKSDKEEMTILNAIAYALQTHFPREGSISLLDKAIVHRERVLVLARGTDDYQFSVLNLGAAYSARFESIGCREDLDRSIELLREVLNCTGAHHDVLCLTAGNLSLSLSRRFEILGDTDDLTEALNLAKQSANTLPSSHIQYGDVISGLANVLIRHYSVHKQRDDLELAINTLSGPISDTDSRRGYRSDWLLQLAQAFMLRYQHSAEFIDDINKAVKLIREAIALRPDGHSRRYEALSALASALSTRYTTYAKIADYEDAMSAQQEVLDLLPNGHTYRTRAFFGMARIYLLEGTPTHSVTNAIKLCIEAIRSNTTVAHLNLKEVLEILPVFEEAAAQPSFHREDRLILLELYREIILIFPRVAYFGLNIRVRLRVLAEAEHIASSAASHALLLNLDEMAVELIEHGRAVFWSQGLRLRDGFDALPLGLGRKLSSVAHRLENGSSENPTAAAKKSTLEEQAKQMRALSAEFEELVTEARLIPGFERFLLDETYGTLSTAAKRGPVVIFLAASQHAYALVLWNNTRIQRVSINANPQKIVGKLDLMLEETRLMRQDIRNNVTDDPQLRLGLNSRRKENHSAVVVEELWTTIMKPVITALGLQRENGRNRPRVWLCPTGAFGLLPLHAAGACGSRPEGCADYCVVSYTPTLKSLLNARRDFKPPRLNNIKALLAAAPVPFRGERLSAVIEEMTIARAVIPSAAMLPLPLETDCTIDPQNGATVRTILDAISDATILHLAGHGTQNHTNALESGFIMQDGMLTVSKLMTLKLPNAFLAVLSACETAKGDSSQPDQAIHLAATMLYVGFRSVIGTMWSMHDMDGPQVSETIYSELFRGNSEYLDADDVAYALDAAVNKLRERRLPVARWAPYVHIGI